MTLYIYNFLKNVFFVASGNIFFANAKNCAQFLAPVLSHSDILRSLRGTLKKKFPHAQLTYITLRKTEYLRFSLFTSKSLCFLISQLKINLDFNWK